MQQRSSAASAIHYSSQHAQQLDHQVSLFTEFTISIQQQRLYKMNAAELLSPVDSGWFLRFYLTHILFIISSISTKSFRHRQRFISSGSRSHINKI
jgi:hypothetical protein